MNNPCRASCTESIGFGLKGGVRTSLAKACIRKGARDLKKTLNSPKTLNPKNAKPVKTQKP